MSLIMPLERQIMAHRYLYYIAARPILGNNEYDDLMQQALTTLPDNSIAFNIGSNLASDYTPAMIADAKLLEFDAKDKTNSSNPGRTIYVVGNQKDYANWMQGSLVSDMKNAKLVVFTGGEDVTPTLYGQRPHITTICSPKRDTYEKGEFNRAKELDLPCIGICRGAQFLCVMAGGKLVQHQENPYHVHQVSVADGRQIHMTSSHHQAQFIWDIPFAERRLMGWTHGLSKYHEDGDGKEMVNGAAKDNPMPLNYLEVEIAYYRKINSLGIQAHPEWHFPPVDGEQREFIEYSRQMLNHLMERTL